MWQYNCNYEKNENTTVTTKKMISSQTRRQNWNFLVEKQNSWRKVYPIIIPAINGTHKHLFTIVSTGNKIELNTQNIKELGLDYTEY